MKLFILACCLAMAAGAAKPRELYEDIIAFKVDKKVKFKESLVREYGIQWCFFNSSQKMYRVQNGSMMKKTEYRFESEIVAKILRPPRNVENYIAKRFRKQ